MIIHKEGRKFLFKLFLFLLGVNIAFIYIFFLSLFFISSSILLFLFFLNFFRRPKRIFTTEDPNIVVAPCDGRVVVIEPTFEDEILHEKRIQISIFMNVFDVHTNWYPVSGKVIYYKHHKGRFIAAHLPKSSKENERSSVLIETTNNIKILVRQIAGAVAKRIVTYAEEGKEYAINDEIGFIKFGSRMDIFLPLDTEILVDLKQKTVANQTVIARLNS